VIDSFSQGNVSGYRQLGGLIGYAETTTISQSSSQAVVTAIGADDYPNYGTGGLIGESYDTDIDNCCTHGTVSAGNNVGGLIGKADVDSTIQNSYATGLIIQTSTTGSFGGLVGKGINATYSDNYFDTWSTSQEYPVGDTTDTLATPLNTCEMKKQQSFVGWDFENTWFIIDDKTYPIPTSQAGPYLGDANIDGSVNFADFAISAQNWLKDI
jgi:hypothetical protein